MYKNICFGRIRFPKNVIGEDGKQFVKGVRMLFPSFALIHPLSFFGSLFDLTIIMLTI